MEEERPPFVWWSEGIFVLGSLMCVIERERFSCFVEGVTVFFTCARFLFLFFFFNGRQRKVEHPANLILFPFKYKHTMPDVQPL